MTTRVTIKVEPFSEEPKLDEETGPPGKSILVFVVDANGDQTEQLALNAGIEHTVVLQHGQKLHVEQEYAD